MQSSLLTVGLTHLSSCPPLTWPSSSLPCTRGHGHVGRRVVEGSARAVVLEGAGAAAGWLGLWIKCLQYKDEDVRSILPPSPPLLRSGSLQGMKEIHCWHLTQQSVGRLRVLCLRLTQGLESWGERVNDPDFESHFPHPGRCILCVLL